MAAVGLLLIAALLVTAGYALGMRGARAHEKARSREADAKKLAAGRLSELEINAKNALKIGHVGFKISPP